MKFKLTVIFIVSLTIIFLSVSAYAISFKDITSWISGTAIAFIITGLLAIGVIAKYTNWISGVLIAIGWLLISIGNATTDSKITKEELQDMKKKWNEVRKAAGNKPK